MTPPLPSSPAAYPDLPPAARHASLAMHRAIRRALDHRLDEFPMSEDVSGHALGPRHRHPDGRMCGWHNRLGVWTTGEVTTVNSSEWPSSTGGRVSMGCLRDDHEPPPAAGGPGRRPVEPACGWQSVCDDSPCGRPKGHTDTPHRVYSPYGDGRWTEFDVTSEAEVCRSQSWLRTDPDLLERGWTKAYNRRLQQEVLVPPASPLAEAMSLPLDPDGLLAGVLAAQVDREASAFRCPKCGAVSAHPMDRRFGYCGACHEFTGVPTDFIIDSELSTEERSAFDERVQEQARASLTAKVRAARSSQRLGLTRLPGEADDPKGPDGGPVMSTGSVDRLVTLPEGFRARGGIVQHRSGFMAAQTDVPLTHYAIREDGSVEQIVVPALVPGQNAPLDLSKAPLPLGSVEASLLAVDVSQAVGSLTHKPGEDLTAIREAIEGQLIKHGIIAGPTKPVGGPPHGNRYARDRDRAARPRPTFDNVTGTEGSAASAAVARELLRQLDDNRRRLEGEQRQWDALAIANVALEAVKEAGGLVVSPAARLQPGDLLRITPGGWDLVGLDDDVSELVEALILTDAVTGNDEGTPSAYTVDAENLDYLVATILTLQTPVMSAERGRALLSAVDTIKQTGGAVEIAGVRIEPCDDYGRTATTKALEAVPEWARVLVAYAEAEAPAYLDFRGVAVPDVIQSILEAWRPRSAPVAPAHVDGQLLLDDEGIPVAMAATRTWAGILGRWRDDTRTLRFLADHARRSLGEAWSAAVEDEPAPREVAEAMHTILGLGPVELVEGGGFR